MKLKNKYFVLRHGQTIYQTKKREIIYPPLPENSDVHLTKIGKDQVKKIAQTIKKEGIDLIFSSDFFRTKETAEIVAKALGKKIIFDKRLRDVNLGVYQGKAKSLYYKDFPRGSSKMFFQKPKGGESWLDCQKRMINFLKEIDKKYQGKKILIVSHGDPLWLLEGAVKKWSIKKLLGMKKSHQTLKNGELRKLN